ncbi:hypothetical protein IFR05_002992 [Cadophora sp. M221]|nr:hypothetical protein IFR05_002992 [Cadophora sp. M221]
MEHSQAALHRLFLALNPLQRLRLEGYTSPEIFKIIVLHHGGNLRNLEIHPNGDDELRNPLVTLTGPVMQRFAEHCPYLTHLSIPIYRTRGNKHEVSIYRSLSKLPRLENLCLRLQYSIAPDEEFWDDERDGKYPLARSTGAKDVPFEYIREAYTNIAIDSRLAPSIFNLVSSNGTSSTGSLKRLKLSLVQKIGRRAPASFGYGTSESTLRYFGRSWLCTRDERGEVVVKELEREVTDMCKQQWGYLLYEDAEVQVRGEEIYARWYKSIWSQKTGALLDDWESLPLDLGGDGYVGEGEV